MKETKPREAVAFFQFRSYSPECGWMRELEKYKTKRQAKIEAQRSGCTKYEIIKVTEQVVEWEDSK